METTELQKKLNTVIYRMVYGVWSDNYGNLDVEIELGRQKEYLNEVIAEAIAAHEAEQWKKFPDWTPEQPSKKICQMKDGSIKIKVASYSSDWSKVMYFRDLPAAYQKGGQE